MNKLGMLTALLGVASMAESSYSWNNGYTKKKPSKTTKSKSSRVKQIVEKQARKKQRSK